MVTSGDSRLNSTSLPILAIGLAAAAALRFLWLGGEFISEDDVRQTWRVIHSPGYLWMVDWATGMLGPLMQKVWIDSVGALGVTATEFWWRAPSVLTGLLQLLLTYPFARHLGISERAALLAFAVLAVLPVHIANSRYTWGHEITGLCCLTMALWALHAFYERPGAKRAIGASLLSALYLVSHHNILPFFPSALLIALASSRARIDPIPGTLARAAWSLVRYGVWIAPLLAFRLYESAFTYALKKPTVLSLYLDTHVRLFVEAVGLPVAVAVAVAIPFGLRTLRGQPRTCLALALCAAAYLAPLFLGAPEHITNVKGYMMTGAWLCILAAAAAVAPRIDRADRRAIAVALALVVLTASGSVYNIFANRRPPLWAPTFAKVEWGRALREPGRKTAALLIRRHVPGQTALFLAQEIWEWPALYYFGRTGCRLPDVNFPFRQVSPEHPCVATVDVIVTRAPTRDWVAAIDRLELKTEVRDRNEPVLWIYAAPEVPLPVGTVHAEELDPVFDAEFTARLSVFR